MQTSRLNHRHAVSSLRRSGWPDQDLNQGKNARDAALKQLLGIFCFDEDMDSIPHA